MSSPYTPPGRDPTGNPHPDPHPPEPALDESVPATTEEGDEGKDEETE